MFERNLEILEEFDNNKMIIRSIMDIRDNLTLFEAQLNVLRKGTNKPLLIEISFELHWENMKEALSKLNNTNRLGEEKSQSN